jgi:hypothetical protein
VISPLLGGGCDTDTGGLVEEEQPDASSETATRTTRTVTTVTTPPRHSFSGAIGTHHAPRLDLLGHLSVQHYAVHREPASPDSDDMTKAGRLTGTGRSDRGAAAVTGPNQVSPGQSRSAGADDLELTQSLT